jgi:hypothetical protein
LNENRSLWTETKRHKDSGASCSDSFSEFGEALKRDAVSRALPWSVERESSSADSSEGGLTEPVTSAQAHADAVLPGVVIPTSLSAVARFEGEEGQKANVFRFDGTAVAIFRKPVVAGNGLQIGLAIDKSYSMSIRPKHLSVNGTVIRSGREVGALPVTRRGR